MDISDAILIPVTIGLVQVFKTIGIPSRFAPLVSIILGIALYCIDGFNVKTDLLAGIIVGLSASGLYSGVKTTVQS